MRRVKTLRITKMQGLGNDYLYVAADALPADAAALAVRLSDRRRGIGADGMIWILPSAQADCAMRIYNADGSEAAMCGNGIRCVGKYLYDHGLTDRTELRVETPAGIRTLRLLVSGGEAVGARVEMGRAGVLPPRRVRCGDDAVTAIPVDLGNPHAVVFLDAECRDAEDAAPCEEEREALADALLHRIGPAMQHDPDWPDGVNVELVRRLGRNRLRMRVWERGSGITAACGTGACASAAAAVGAGLCEAGVPIELVLDGGSLQITVRADGSVVMEGPAETVFEGELAYAE